MSTIAAYDELLGSFVHRSHDCIHDVFHWRVEAVAFESARFWFLLASEEEFITADATETYPCDRERCEPAPEAICGCKRCLSVPREEG